METTTNHSGIRILIIPALCCLLSVTSSCNNTNDPMYNKSSNTTYTKGANEVYIQGMAFSPATLTITAGTTVKWNNKDAVAHTVTSDSTLFDSGIISANGIYTYTFAKEGTYFYHCELHANMKAKVIVNAYVPPSGGYTGY